MPEYQGRLPTRPVFPAHLQNSDKLKKKSFLLSLPAAVTCPATRKATPTTRTRSSSGKVPHTLSLCSYHCLPSSITLPNSPCRLLSQETKFGEQSPKDMHSTHFSNFSNICQSTKHVHILTKLLWFPCGITFTELHLASCPQEALRQARRSGALR